MLIANWASGDPTKTPDHLASAAQLAASDEATDSDRITAHQLCVYTVAGTGAAPELIPIRTVDVEETKLPTRQVGIGELHTGALWAG